LPSGGSYADRVRYLWAGRKDFAAFAAVAGGATLAEALEYALAAVD
jgi:hypothetical protein